MTVHGDSMHFKVGPHTGTIISGSSSFNYEEKSLYRMQFKAQETTDLFSTCLVDVRVKDLNDNSPKFSTGSYDGRVLENSPKGTPVIRVHADDVDTGSGAEVK